MAMHDRKNGHTPRIDGLSSARAVLPHASGRSDVESRTAEF